MRRGFEVLAVFWVAGAASAGAQGDEGKLAKRVGKIDAKFVKALEDLAVKYDGEKDLEAASFFAECAVGFGSKDEKAKAVKLGNELDVYLGKVQGGKPLEKTGPIRQKLDSLTKEYREVLDDIRKKSGDKQSELSEGELKILFDVAVKYELARGADEYVKATKRVNELRKGMKLRSVLWDFENSRKLILGCAPAAAGWTPYANNARSLNSIFYDAGMVKFMVENSGRGVGNRVVEWVDVLRAYATVRKDLLNPNSRRLWLGHWETLDNSCSAYRIPQLPYREDVPTPTKRHEGATVAQDWIDTEETVDVNGKKIPFSRYPFDGETDLPWYFGMPGDGGLEEGWDGVSGKKLTDAGLPIMLRFFGKATLSDAEASMIASRTGREIAVDIYTDSEKGVPGIREWPTIVVLPQKEILRGVLYTVTIKCKLDGVPFERTWSFTTKAPQ